MLQARSECRNNSASLPEFNNGYLTAKGSGNSTGGICAGVRDDYNLPLSAEVRTRLNGILSFVPITSSSLCAGIRTVTDSTR